MNSSVSEIAVSVIVPVFNARSSIKQCVESLLHQTTDFRYEIILIDDGSTDGSAEFMDLMEKVHKEVIVFHQSNSGVSAARNTGLTNARGRYVAFVDSDDYVTPCYIKHLYEAMHNTGKVQIVIAGFIRCYTHGKRPVTFKSQDVVLAENPTFLDEYKLYYWGMPFSKLYDLDIICRHSICFAENVRYSEDLIFLLTYLQWVNSVRFINHADYYYQCDNISSLINSHHSYEVEYAGYCGVHNALHAFMRNNRVQPTQIPRMYDWVKLFLFRTIKSLYRLNKLLPTKKKVRLLRLNELWENIDVNSYMKRDYSPNYLDRLISFLFVRKYLKILDLFLTVFWRLRSSYLVDLYLKQKK